MSEDLKARWQTLKDIAGRIPDDVTDEEIARAITVAIEEVRLEKAIEKHIPPVNAKMLVQFKDREFFRARVTRHRGWVQGWPAEGTVGVVERLIGFPDLHYFWHEGEMYSICLDEFERLQ